MGAAERRKIATVFPFRCSEPIPILQLKLLAVRTARQSTHSIVIIAAASGSFNPLGREGERNSECEREKREKMRTED